MTCYPPSTNPFPLETGSPLKGTLSWSWPFIRPTLGLTYMLHHRPGLTMDWSTWPLCGRGSQEPLYWDCSLPWKEETTTPSTRRMWAMLPAGPSGCSLCLHEEPSLWMESWCPMGRFKHRSERGKMVLGPEVVWCVCSNCRWLDVIWQLFMWLIVGHM